MEDLQKLKGAEVISKTKSDSGRRLPEGERACMSTPFDANAVVAICSDKGLTLETSAFQNSLWRLIYPYELYVDN